MVVLMTSREKLLQEIEAFLVRTGMTQTSFGRDSIRDPAIVADIRKGKNPRLDTADKLRAFMASWEPEPNPKRAAQQVAA